MTKEFTKLFSEDLIFIEEAKDSEDIFNKIGKKLIEKGMVKDSFIDAVISREKDYPTGLDLSVIDNTVEVPNVAIPHTESKYCNTKKVVVVKLKKEIVFNDMISPDYKLKVRFLFMILNNEKGKQCNILADLMNFFTKNKNFLKLAGLNDTSEIYKYIVA